MNGSVRPLFPNTRFIGVDRYAGSGVDVIADGRSWGETASADVVVMTSVFEHEPGWLALVENAARLLKPGGLFICTTVRDPYPVHSGIEPVGYLLPGEEYVDVHVDEFVDALRLRFADWWVHLDRGGNLCGYGVKG